MATKLAQAFTLFSVLLPVAGLTQAHAQTLDPFAITPDDAATSAAAEPDGNLLIGGLFHDLSGTPRDHFARLLTNGSVDPELTIGVNTGASVNCILVHPDGSIYVGGNFTEFGGEMHGYVAHILADSTIDSDFAIGADGTVQALALQSDGRILVGGAFGTFGGQARSRLARMNPDGTLDPTFTASANNEIVSMLVQPDDSIVIAGRFTMVNGEPRGRLAKLDVDGVLDATFNPNANEVVAGMAQAADGDIIAFGNFTEVGGNPQAEYVRLNPDGSVDTGFVLPDNTDVASVVAQADGDLLVAGTFNDDAVTGTAVIRVNSDGSFDSDFTPAVSNGSAHLILDGTGFFFAAGPFTNFMGSPRTFLARVLSPTEPSYALELDTATNDISWTLGGGAPVPTVVFFESSVDGTTWTPLGAGLKDAGDTWVLPAATLPTGTTQLRAFGVVPTNGSDSTLILRTATLGGSPGAPVITVGPVDHSAVVGDDVTLSVTATGDGELSYQWEKDGVAIDGATDATFVITDAQVDDSGTYTVVVTNDSGSVESAGAVITISGDGAAESRLLNLSVRAPVGTGDSVMIPGFVIAGSEPKRLLIRAVGPRLTSLFGLQGVLPDPQIELHVRNNSTGNFEVVTTNDNWGDNDNADDIVSVSADLFAFSLQDEEESALLLDLDPGQYTVVVRGAGETTGIALCELYDADDASVDSRLINISNRGFAGLGDEVMIPGFVISSEGPKTVLLRAVGPGLVGQGVSDTMEDPKLDLYRQGNNTPIATQDNWSEDPEADNIAAVAEQVFAFPLEEGSADAAMVVELEPGVYTAIGSSAVEGGTGVILVEVYVVP